MPGSEILKHTETLSCAQHSTATICDRPLLTYGLSPADGNLLRMGLPLARLRRTLATSFAVR